MDVGRRLEALSLVLHGPRVHAPPIPPVKLEGGRRVLSMTPAAKPPQFVTSSQEEDRKSCGAGDCSQGPRGKCFSAFTGLERDGLERGLCRKLCSDIFIPGTPLNLPQS